MFKVYAGLSHLLVMRRELTYRYSPSSFCSRTVSFPIGRRTLERIGGGLKINHSNTCSRSSNSSLKQFPRHCLDLPGQNQTRNHQIAQHDGRSLKDAGGTLSVRLYIHKVQCFWQNMDTLIGYNLN